MLPCRTILIVTSLLVWCSTSAQHPNREKINRLEALLPTTQGMHRVDCLNALSEEYWWPPKVLPDSISCWAIPAHNEALRLGYTSGIATAIMHLGVAELYRKNFRTAENYLRQALPVFENRNNGREVGWCNLWLGQTLYGENNFKDAIACYIKSSPLLRKSGDGEGEGKVYAWMSFLYEAIGDYDSSFYYCNKSLQIREKMSDEVCIAGALVNMGHLYKAAGAFDDAIGYYKKGWQYASTHDFNVRTTNWNNMHEAIGTVYRLKDMLDSSVYYIHQAIQIDPENQLTYVSFGETLLAENKYDSALTIFLPPIEHYRKENDNWDLMRLLLDVAEAYEGKKKEATALQYAAEGFSLAKSANIKPYMIQGYLLLSKIYNHLKENDRAYFFMQQYISLKDSVSNKQFLWRLTNYKKQADFNAQLERIASLDKDNKILDKDNRIKEEKLKRAIMLKWTLIIGLLIALMSGTFIFRNLTLKRKNENLEHQRKQSELKLTAAELEMQALRAQMNPHFIFNCLSSINSFILKSETQSASDYLTKFSRLIRMVLTNSNKSFIPLEDELDMLRLYLDMERLRFKNAFDYNIVFENTIDSSNILVPPLLLQPFAENAIWHGLMHKEGHGTLNIALSTENDILNCVITDNGVGRDKAAQLKSKSANQRKSMGLQITAERLALLNKDLSEQTHFTIEDVVDSDGKVAGTQVILKLHVRSLIDAYA